MKLTCPDCNGEQLDQGATGKILCHNCKMIFMLIKVWNGSGV